jgi:hypothetical protein
MNQETTKTTQNESAKALQDDLIVLLCAPAHDKLTNYTSTLLESLPSLNRPTNLRKFSEPLTYDSLLQQLSIDSDTDVAVVFCGHGDQSSLLGPPAGPNSTAKTCFYDATFLDSGPKYMLAMCCSAAVGLARAFDARADRIFIGFDREIGFVLSGGVYAEWWGKVLHSCADAMLNCNNLDDLRTTVQQVYKSALAAFPRRHRYGLLMTAYLRRQLESIDFVRT